MVNDGESLEGTLTMDGWSPIAVYEMVRVMQRERAKWYETAATVQEVTPERYRLRPALATLVSWLLQIGRGV
ncbi:hypothetical protein HRbin26_02170 [bacterium HR26]|nr:hypothetical protein HRbin26_02170 [bacterium HR26]